MLPTLPVCGTKTRRSLIFGDAGTAYAPKIKDPSKIVMVCPVLSYITFSRGSSKEATVLAEPDKLTKTCIRYIPASNV